MRGRRHPRPKHPEKATSCLLRKPERYTVGEQRRLGTVETQEDTMNPSRERYYRGLFLVATIYDVGLGLAFTFFYRQLFELLEVTPPESGYIPLIGTFLFVIGVAYYLIWRGDLYRNRDMIFVGTLYKLAYGSVAIVFWSMGDIPHVSFGAIFGIADLVFFILMLECWLFLRRSGQERDSTAGQT
jgi:hypothetical protein